MKSFTILLTTLTLMAFTGVQKKQRVIFFGDSITQAGVEPGGYITKMQEMLAASQKSAAWELSGAGIGGNKIYDLYLRMEDDVLAKNPDIVFVWVGVNDVWHKASSGTGTDADKFEKFYKALIAKLQAKKIKVVLCTPAAIGERTDFSNQLDGDLNHYSNIVRDIASKTNCGLVDLRKAVLAYNLSNNPQNKESGILTDDGVHLNAKGNAFVAEEMMKVMLKL